MQSSARPSPLQVSKDNHYVVIISPKPVNILSYDPYKELLYFSDRSLIVVYIRDFDGLHLLPFTRLKCTEKRLVSLRDVFYG